MSTTIQGTGTSKPFKVGSIPLTNIGLANTKSMHRGPPIDFEQMALSRKSNGGTNHIQHIKYALLNLDTATLQNHSLCAFESEQSLEAQRLLPDVIASSQRHNMSAL